MKTQDEYFRDWISEFLPFGYGSGEPHTIPVLRKCLEMAMRDEKGTYDYQDIEIAVTPAVAWLLIMVCCQSGVFEYGSSPRFGWLSAPGKRLRAYMLAHDERELIQIATDYDESYAHCTYEYCNCDETRGEHSCPNPFWREKLNR